MINGGLDLPDPSSTYPSDSAVTRSIPQMSQGSCLDLTISGCMGQIHFPARFVGTMAPPSEIPASTRA
jgi:hypothetical protein